MTKPRVVMEFGGEITIPAPADREIRFALESFDAQKAKDGSAFVILTRSDANYVQAFGEKTLGLSIEFREGGPDYHYRAERSDFTVEEVFAMLCGYRDGNLNWKGAAEWAHMDM